MQNLLYELIELLSKDERLVVDGKLLKNKIIELALAMDSKLIKLLLEKSKIKNTFSPTLKEFLFLTR
jgi:adenine-specific DNA-methyltransferase